MLKLLTSSYALEPIIQLAVVIPLALLFVKNHSKDTYKYLGLFALIYFIYELVLVLPRFYPVLYVTDSNWNWEGKFLGIVWGVISYLLVKKSLKNHDYITLKQDKQGFKPALIAGIIVVLIAIGLWMYYDEKEDFDWDTLAYQLTLPGIDEELMFRGVLFGLLLNALKDHIRYFGNPSIWLTALLFGFIHGFRLDENFEVQFSYVAILQTGFAGWVWAWMTLKSRSILLAIFSHNLSNFCGVLWGMLR